MTAGQILVILACGIAVLLMQLGAWLVITALAKREDTNIEDAPEAEADRRVTTVTYRDNHFIL